MPPNVANRRPHIRQFGEQEENEADDEDDLEEVHAGKSC